MLCWFFHGNFIQTGKSIEENSLQNSCSFCCLKLLKECLGASSAEDLQPTLLLWEGPSPCQHQDCLLPPSCCTFSSFSTLIRTFPVESKEILGCKLRSKTLILQGNQGQFCLVSNLLMKAFLNISPKNNFQRFINFLQPWLTTVVFPYNIVKLEMLLKLIQCLKFHFFNGNRPW